MVHKWFVKKGLRKAIYGTFTIVLGLFLFVIQYPYPIIEREIRLTVSGKVHYFTRLYLNDIAIILIPFGIFLLLIGAVYSLVTVILEYLKKRRHANRSKICVSSKIWKRKSDNHSRKREA